MKRLVNSILFFSVIVFVQCNLAYATIVKINPGTIDLDAVGVGGTFDVTVDVEDVYDLSGFEFAVSYDPDVVTIEENSQVTMGDFLKDVKYLTLTENALNNLRDSESVPNDIITKLENMIYEVYATENEFSGVLKEEIGEEQFAQYGTVIQEFAETLQRTVMPLPISIDNNTGKLKIGLLSYGNTSGSSGNGTLTTVTFSVKSLAKSTLDLNNLQLINSNGNPMFNVALGDAKIICSSCVDTCLGDINGDDKVDLKDAILVLKLLCGISVSSEEIKITTCTDINGDRKIGFEEVLYILQTLGNVR